MVNVKEVPADLLVNELALQFGDMKNIEIPEWTLYTKSGVHREKGWTQEDWYYRRLASTLRKVYVNGNIGIQRLSEEYGGKKDGGSKPYHPASGSRSIVRHMFNKLEELGLVKKSENGRVVTPNGQAMLDKASKKVMERLAEERPELKKYL
ncbi:MAG: 30S ribosomal protein S19e [Candidatus Thermoplasmatota archaeon]|jgi:small subunit ribosomal protein S19e|nr:30S ribosomal protein S19e [Candidatus Thermoplasmatota archaeon]